MDHSEATKRTHNAAISGAALGGVVGYHASKAMLDIAGNIISGTGKFIFNFSKDGAAGYNAAGVIYFIFFVIMSIVVTGYVDSVWESALFIFLLTLPISLLSMVLTWFNELKKIGLGSTDYPGAYNIGFFATLIMPIVYIAALGLIAQGITGILPSSWAETIGNVIIAVGEYIRSNPYIQIPVIFGITVTSFIWIVKRHFRFGVGLAAKRFFAKNPKAALAAYMSEAGKFDISPFIGAELQKEYIKRAKLYGALPVHVEMIRWVWSAILFSIPLVLILKSVGYLIGFFMPYFGF